MPKYFRPKSRPDLPGPFRISREQYHRLGELGFFENRRVELIRGEIIEMSPMGWPHSLAVGVVGDLLREVFRGKGWVQEQRPVVNVHSEPEPDVAVLPGTRRDFKAHPTTALLIVEVAASSLDYDTEKKAKLYAECSIPDYWVLDLENRQLWVFRDPVEGEFRTQFKLAEADSISPLAAPEAPIKIAEMLP